MYLPDGKKECFVHNLKLFCKTNNFTNRDIAALLGVGESTIQSWLSMRSMPEGKSVEALEKIFNTKFDKICSSIITIKLQLDRITTIEDIFPYNCISAASSGYGLGTFAIYEDSDDDDFDMKYRSVTPADFDNIFTNQLTYREQTVVQLRYRDGCTLDDCGKKIGITRERVRQVEYKALRKINVYVDRIIKSKPTIDELREENAKLRDYIVALEAAKSISEVERPVEVTSPALDTVIEDLDFKVRTYNCLKRARINTIYDIVNYPESFFRIRNLGKQSLEEIVSKIEILRVGYAFDSDTNRFVLENPQQLPNYIKPN